METHFRKNLRDELDYQDISVKELSEKTGISKRTLENYLGNKETIPPADYACRIAKVLNVSVEKLVMGAPFALEKERLDAKTNSLIRDMQKLSKENQDLLLYMIHAAASR